MRHAWTITAIALIASAALTSGCARKQTNEAPAAAAPDTASTGTPAEQPGTTSPSDVSAPTAQSYIDDVTIGKTVAADGTVPADQKGDDFAPGEPVHIAMKVNDAPPNTTVKVIWFGPHDTKVGEETKNIASGEKYLDFAAQNTKSWKKGDYRAEVWVGDEKVNQQEFNVTDASKAKSG